MRPHRRPLFEPPPHIIALRTQRDVSGISTLTGAENSPAVPAEEQRAELITASPCRESRIRQRKKELRRADCRSLATAQQIFPCFFLREKIALCLPCGIIQRFPPVSCPAKKPALGRQHAYAPVRANGLTMHEITRRHGKGSRSCRGRSEKRARPATIPGRRICRAPGRENISIPQRPPEKIKNIPLAAHASLKKEKIFRRNRDACGCRREKPLVVRALLGACGCSFAEKSMYARYAG